MVGSFLVSDINVPGLLHPAVEANILGSTTKKVMSTFSILSTD